MPVFLLTGYSVGVHVHSNTILGYAQWKNFIVVIEKAKKAFENVSNVLEDHFSDVGKMVEIGSGTKRTIGKTLKKAA